VSDPLTIAPVRADQQQRREARPAGDVRDAPGVFDTIAAGFDVGYADTSTATQDFQLEAYKPVIDALLELQPDANFSRYINPARGTVSPESIWRDVARFRKQGRFSDLPLTYAEFEKQWRDRKRGEIERAEDTMSRGNFGAGLLGAAGGAMLDPVNIYTLPLGGYGKTVSARIINQGLTQMAIQTAQLPGVQAQREDLGRRDLTLGESAMLVGGAGIGGAGFQGVFEGGRFVLPKVINALDPNAEAKAYARAFEDMVPPELRTPEQDAALFVLRRSAEVEDASPYVRTIEGVDTHVAKMEAALRALEEGRIARPEELAEAVAPVAPMPAPAPRPAGGEAFDLEAVKAAIRGPESGGNDSAKNAMGSSATGRYQFVEDTFVGVYRREYGVSEAVARRAWATSRNNVDVQERLMDRLTRDNAAALQRAGLTADAGNLYLAHFAGSGKAVELLRAPKDAPVSAFFSAKAIRQNPTYLGGGKTVGEAIDIIRGKVGDPAQRSPAPIDPKLFEPELRDPRLDAERPVVALGGQTIGTSTFKASEIGVDAELMQFKSGGDQFGVTDRLRTVEEWDSYQAGFVTVWEGLDGRRLIADGHQRLGLAKRISARTGEDIQLNAYVLREADGISAADARRITALRNVAEGSGTRTDAAKVFRDLAPEEVEAVLRRMAKGGEFIKDARGLARLEGEAFGAVINEVVPENYGAAIGQLVDDPALHMGMVKILAETQPANRRQAEAIIRQAIDAGFVKETQESLFGTEQLMTGLFAQRAKLLDRALSELKRLKGAFGVAVRNADTLEAGGNKIDVAGSAAEVDANARALALVNALALRKGNAVNELLTRAAERIAAGESPAAVLKQFVADVRKLDLDAIAGEAGDAGGRGAGDGAGRGDGDGGDAGPVDDGPGLFGRDADDFGPTPAELDAAAAAKPRSDHTDLPPGPDPKFEEPDGPGIVAAAESAWHDIRLSREEATQRALKQEAEERRARIERQMLLQRGERSMADLAPVLFREASVRNALDLIPGSPNQPNIGFSAREIYMATGRDLALGQGDNRGVMLQFDSTDLTGRVNFKKPNAEHMLLENRLAEVMISNDELAIRKTVRAITIDQAALAQATKTDRIVFERTVKELEAKGWVRSEADGQTTWTRPEPVQPEASVAARVAEEAPLDRGADVDPNIAARQRQEAQLGADAPMRAPTDQDGTMGLGLFDSVDQKSLFDLGDGRGERAIADIRAEIDADKAAIDTLRSCMT
jgi:hypothetical protein